MKKHTYEYVKEFIEKENYKLLSTEYINSRTKLEIKCPKGHVYNTGFIYFKNMNCRCPKCFGKSKFTYEQVKEYIEKENYQLLSTEYIDTHKKLKMKCDKNHIFEMKFYSFKNGNRCFECSKIKKSNSYKDVKNYIKSYNYSLLSKEYKGSRDKLDILCPNNHIFKMRYNDFQQGRRCPECIKQQVTSKGEKEVFEYIKSIYSNTVIENDRKTILNPLTNRFLELDIYLPDLKIAIEYNGDY